MNRPAGEHGLGSVYLRDGSIELSRVGLGGGPLGNLFSVVTEDEASRLLEHALALGVRYFDTAPVYGMGLAETRLGRALDVVDRAGVAVSTKVGRVLRADAPADPELFVDSEPFFKDAPALNPVWDFTTEGITRSLTESLERLTLDRVEIAYLHEPPDHLIDAAATDGYRALRALRDAGVVGAIGVGWDRVEPMISFVCELDLDCAMLASRYSLLDQSALPELLPACLERDTPVLVGGVFNSGILAGVDPGATYDYLPPTESVQAAVQSAKRICSAWEVPLRAVALQFPLAHPAVAGVVLGMRSAEELDDNLAMLDLPIPGELWAALKEARILDGDAPTPEPG